jgi:DNA modification methylase
MSLIQGDCLEKLKSLADDSIDSIVTDPPYGLRFMGKAWDYDVPSVEIWRECLRVLKPGGHLLAFGGTRTYHRLAVNIEDAGFEIRDQIQWIYGSGFPKSMDISKAIDKQAGAVREVIGEVVRSSSKGLGHTVHQSGGDKTGISSITAPATEAAKAWSGYGTALKPANEPICMARKPLEAKLTVAANVLKYGTGGLNIDASRIGAGTPKPVRVATAALASNGKYGEGLNGSRAVEDSTEGRWPANIILDESAAAALDEQSGIKPSNVRKNKKGTQSDGVTGWQGSDVNPPDDSGGASRFFYVAKASKRERGEGNSHPTVKPVTLMAYLVKLVTPSGGTCLDPFMGSGTTGLACVSGGFVFVGIELDESYFNIASARISSAKRVKHG